MSGNSGFYSDRDERRRLRHEARDQRRARRGQCDSLAHAIRGPLTLITVGALFAINNFTPYGFDKTWPVILIVFGLLTLVGRSTAQPLEPVAPPEAPGAPPPSFDSTPPPSSYRQSSYSQAPQQEEPADAGPAGTSKGGFGTSAHQRQPETGQEGRPGGPPHLGGTV